MMRLEVMNLPSVWREFLSKLISPLAIVLRPQPVIFATKRALFQFDQKGNSLVRTPLTTLLQQVTNYK